MKARHSWLIPTTILATTAFAMGEGLKPVVPIPVLRYQAQAPETPPKPADQQQPQPAQPPQAQPDDAQAEQANISPEARQVLEKMRDAYSQLKTMELAGTVTTELNIGGQEQKSDQNFTASFQSPNQFRHDFNDQILVGSTGEEYYVYSRSDNAFLQSPIEEDRPIAEQLPRPLAQVLQSQNPSLLLAIQRDPLRDINAAGVEVNKIDDVQVDGRAYNVLELHGGDGTPRVHLYIDPQTHLIRRLSTDIRESLEAGGAEDVRAARFQIDYTKVESGVNFEREHFAWKPPEGARDMAQVVEEGPQALNLVGQQAPDFTLRDFDNKEVKLSELRGKPVLLDFWATWCPPCVESMPHLQNLHSEKGEALHIYAINLREERDKVQQFLKQHELDLPVLLDTQGQVGQQYHVRSIPQTVLIDAKGVVRQVYIGFAPDTYARIKRDIANLDEAAPAAPAAPNAPQPEPDTQPRPFPQASN